MSFKWQCGSFLSSYSYVYYDVACEGKKMESFIAHMEAKLGREWNKKRNVYQLITFYAKPLLILVLSLFLK